MSDTPDLAAQAQAKAEAKANADHTVATEPHARHGIRMAFGSPTVVASTLTGAGIGAMAGGPPGALVGGVIGNLVERHGIMGGPVGWIWKKVRGFRG
jgi:hypothetical protein